MDLKQIAENLEDYKKAIKDKKINLDLDGLLRMDQKRRELVTQVDELRHQRNLAAQQRDIEQGKKIKEELKNLEIELEKIEAEVFELSLKIPTIPAPDTPVGESEDDNQVIYTWGDKKEFKFKPLNHIELGKKLDILDLERGSKVGGYKAYYLKNEGAVLVMALMMYAFQKCVQAGFLPMIPPTLVKEFVLFGTGYFKGSRFNPETDEVYQVMTPQRDLDDQVAESKFLVGTAEPSLLAYYSGEILDESKLPLKICGFSPCYRSEIGSYGQDTRGIYRVHEFFKVEQVILAPADIELADKLHLEMTDISKKMHEELGLPYQQIRICSGDLSVGKYKQFDIEAWMPGLERYGETGSASNFLDWQSKRLKVKYKNKEGEIKEVFMLNNTALPSPRVFIAILENFQQEDGSVIVPEVLVPYTNFSRILPKAA